MKSNNQKNCHCIRAGAVFLYFRIMNRIQTFIVYAALLFICTSCLNAQQSTKGRTDLTVSQFKEYLAKNPTTILLDVRTPEEFTAGHLKNAVNIPVNDTDFEAKVSKFDKTQVVMVYCRSGHRSVMASGKLLTLGFVSILNLEKGINSWQAAGEQTVK
ncbi:MAG: rhodanese-like protein [Bacteroidetes bacterium]|nr:rhodanese-like protein [Bacteroidota bacterium]